MALPHEMIDEILCRVPVKPLLRFRCVSKGWCSLIDSNAFAKKQLKNTLACNAGVGLMIVKHGDDRKFYLAGFDSLDDESADLLEIDDPLKSFLSDAQIMGACNGLICVFKNKRKDIFVLNPTTRNSRKIAGVPIEFPSLFSTIEKRICGFGYDEVSDDFKVVMIAECYVQFHGLIAMVYSLKTDAWTRIQDVPSNIRFINMRGLFASGCLHWMAIDDRTNGKEVIVGFDLELQQFKDVPFPPIEPTRAKFSERILDDVGEYVSILDCLDLQTDVWLMNNHGAETTWYKALSKEDPEVIGTFRLTKLVAFSRSGEDVLLLVRNDYNTKLVWYNLDKKTRKNIQICGLPVHFSLIRYTESLLQLTEEPLQQNPLKDKLRKNKKEKRRDDFLSRGFSLRL